MAAVLVQLKGHGGYPGGQERGRPPTPLSFSAPTCRSMHHAGLVVQPPQDAATIEAYLAGERARWRKVIEERGLTLDSVQ